MPQSTSSVHPSPPDFLKFPSRRSVVHSTKGIVACTQPLAAKCGIDILNAGGNAADAAVAVAAGMNITEPCSTGIGGDMFLLYWDAKTKKVSALNGSGRSPQKSTIERVRKDLDLPENPDKESKESDEIPSSSVHAVTVPGAAAGWVDTIERFGSGKVKLEEVLAPAIKLGEEGFPVSEIASLSWQRSENLLRNASPNFAEMLKQDPKASDGSRAPLPGEILKNPTLAKTFRTLATEGKKGFYTGRIAEQLVKVLSPRGGLLTLEDLQHHLETGSEPVDPISLKFNGQGLGEEDGLELWEHPPNGQGIVALMALGIIQELEKQEKIPKFGKDEFNSTAYLHVIIESLKLAFTDAHWYVTDPNVVKVPSEELISSEYLATRAKLFTKDKALPDVEHGDPSPALRSSDTVYFAVSDAKGNAASFINSNYEGFGTGIIPEGCGFTLQNRGSNFSLNPSHPNAIAPRKRPYHTIIPGLVTNLADSSLHSVFGVMGGFMQPQGHVQVLLGQSVFGLNPQQALDAPRVCIEAGASADKKSGVEWTVNVEEGVSEETVEGLKGLGHKVEVLTGSKRARFGRGQIIRYSEDGVEGTKVWSAGSDLRGDGAAYPA